MTNVPIAEGKADRAESWEALKAVTVVVGILLTAWIVIPPFVFDRPPKYWLETTRGMKGLEIAIKGYQTEYNRYPLATPTAAATVMASEGQLLKVLMAEDHELNPKRVRFLDPPLAKNGKGGFLIDSAGQPRLVDFYGHPYLICIDYDGDGEIVDPQTKDEKQPDTLSSGVIIWSGGKDGDLTTWKDNLSSWQ